MNRSSGVSCRKPGLVAALRRGLGRAEKAVLEKSTEDARCIAVAPCEVFRMKFEERHGRRGNAEGRLNCENVFKDCETKTTTRPTSAPHPAVINHREMAKAELDDAV